MSRTPVAVTPASLGTFEVTATFEIQAATEADAQQIWEENGPELGEGIAMNSRLRWKKLPSAAEAARDHRKAAIARHLKTITHNGRHQGAVKLAAHLLTTEPTGRYCVSGLCGPETMTFYTDDLKEAVDRSNEWAQRLARTYVETHITDLDRDPVRRTFQITATFEIVAETAEEAEGLWADNGPEVGPGITMDPLPTWTEVANSDRDGGTR